MYNNVDYDNAVEALFRRCPNRLHLAEAYKKMACRLKKEVIADEAMLIAECGMEEIYLTVFEELNFINRSGGKVSMAAVRRNRP